MSTTTNELMLKHQRAVIRGLVRALGDLEAAIASLEGGSTAAEENAKLRAFIRNRLPGADPAVVPDLSGNEFWELEPRTKELEAQRDGLLVELSRLRSSISDREEELELEIDHLKELLVDALRIGLPEELEQ